MGFKQTAATMRALEVRHCGRRMARYLPNYYAMLPNLFTIADE